MAKKIQGLYCVVPNYLEIIKEREKIKMESEFKVGDYAIYKEANVFSLVKIKELFVHDIRDRLKQDGLTGPASGTTFHKENSCMVQLHKNMDIRVILVSEYNLIKIDNEEEVLSDIYLDNRIETPIEE